MSRPLPSASAMLRAPKHPLHAPDRILTPRVQVGKLRLQNMPTQHLLPRAWCTEFYRRCVEWAHKADKLLPSPWDSDQRQASGTLYNHTPRFRTQRGVRCALPHHTGPLAIISGKQAAFHPPAPPTTTRTLALPPPAWAEEEVLTECLQASPREGSPPGWRQRGNPRQGARAGWRTSGQAGQGSRPPQQVQVQRGERQGVGLSQTPWRTSPGGQ